MTPENFENGERPPVQTEWDKMEAAEDFEAKWARICAEAEQDNARIVQECEARKSARASERLEKAERKAAAWNKYIKRAGAAAAAGLALAGVLFLNADSGINEGPKSIEEQSYHYEVTQASSIIISGAPNLRSQPYIANRADPDNSYGRVGEGDTIEIEIDGDVYVVEDYRNGAWYGVDAEKIAGGLLEDNYITEKQAAQISKDKDGIAWVNSNYAQLTKANGNG